MNTDNTTANSNQTSLCCYSWENKTFVLLRTKTWEKLRNGWFKAELTDGTNVSHMGMRQWRDNDQDALDDLIQRVCFRVANRALERKHGEDPEASEKLIALGKLIESFK